MDTNSENTFGNIQQEERYKKLERTLKILLMKQSDQRRPNVGNFDPAWPSMSSINGDQLDASCTGFSMYSSRFGSEVVASSNNMQNKAHSKILNNHHQMITSSVKKIPIGNDNSKERALMPPPKSIGVLAHSSRKNSPAGPVITGLIPVVHPAGPGNESLGTKYNDTTVINNPNSEENKKDTSHSELDQSKQNIGSTSYIHKDPDRIFSKWRVMLNDKSQLIVKGTLECGKVARSKPVINRITSDKVLSKFRHIYSLEGNIFDERNELPTYVRGKFYNGFPDDWENVYEVWKNYQATGFSPNFRWPTPVTDDDDDLLSGITEITVKKPSRRCKTKQKSEKQTIKDLNSNIPVPTGPVSNPAVIDKRDSDLPQKQLNASHCSCSKSGIIHEEMQLHRGKHDGNNTIDDFINGLNISRPNTPSSTISSTHKSKVISLTDLIHQDKLKIILENLMKPNCSAEYKEKLCQMFDSLKYFISLDYNDEGGSDEGKKEITLTETERQTPQNISHVSNELKKPSSLEEAKNMEMVFNKRCAENVIKPDKAPSARKKLTSCDYGTSESSGKESDIEKYPSKSSKNRRESLKRRKPFVLNRKPSKENMDTVQQNSPPRKNCHKSEVGNGVVIINEFKAPEFLPQSKPKYNHTGSNKMKSNHKQHPTYPSDVSITEDERKIKKIRQEQSEAKHVRNEIRQKASGLISTQKPTALWRGNHESNFSISGGELQENIGRNQNEMKNKVFLESNARTAQHRLKENHNPRCGDVNKHMHEKFNDFQGNKENEKVDSIDHREVINKIEQVHMKSPSPTEKRRKPIIVDIKKVSMNSKVPETSDPQVASETVNHKSPVDNNENPNQENDIIIQNHFPPPRSRDSTVKTKDLRVTLQDFKLKTKEHDRISRDKSTSDENLEKMESAVFGSKSNPKNLTAWRPKRERKADNEFGLIFEGTLLNEAGHAADRKYSTDLVLRRLNSHLIETENHEFYQLVGDLSDAKHKVPKEIRKLCHNGCPPKIDVLCDKWKQLDEYDLRIDNSDIDVPNASISGKGRRILPQLNYWQGEKLMAGKHGKVVYSPKIHEECSLASLTELSNRDIYQSSPRKRDTSAKDSSTASIAQKEKPSRSRENNAVKFNQNSKVESDLRQDQKKIMRKRRVSRKSRMEYFESSEEDEFEKVDESPEEARMNRHTRSTKRKIVLESRKKYNESSDEDDCYEPVRSKRKKKISETEDEIGIRRTSESNDVIRRKGRSRKQTPEQSEQLMLKSRQNSQVSNGSRRRPGMIISYKENVPYEDEFSADEISVM